MGSVWATAWAQQSATASGPQSAMASGCARTDRVRSACVSTQLALCSPTEQAARAHVPCGPSHETAVARSCLNASCYERPNLSAVSSTTAGAPRRGVRSWQRRRVGRRRRCWARCWRRRGLSSRRWRRSRSRRWRRAVHAQIQYAARAYQPSSPCAARLSELHARMCLAAPPTRQP